MHIRAAEQAFGDGAQSAQATVPALLFLRLRDKGGNMIKDASTYLNADITAALFPLPDDPVEIATPINLTYSPSDHAIVGTYTPFVAAVHILRLETGMANPRRHPMCNSACDIVSS